MDIQTLEQAAKEFVAVNKLEADIELLSYSFVVKMLGVPSISIFYAPKFNYEVARIYKNNSKFCLLIFPKINI